MNLQPPYAPAAISDIELAFPGRVEHLIPAWSDIPDDFKNEAGAAARWVKFQRDWFFRGFPKGTRLEAKPGVDVTLAMRHLKAIQGSFEPKHEHKEAAVAFLASLWLAKPPGGA